MFKKIAFAAALVASFSASADVQSVAQEIAMIDLCVDYGHITDVQSVVEYTNDKIDNLNIDRNEIIDTYNEYKYLFRTMYGPEHDGFANSCELSDAVFSPVTEADFS